MHILLIILLAIIKLELDQVSKYSKICGYSWYTAHQYFSDYRLRLLWWLIVQYPDCLRNSSCFRCSCCDIVQFAIIWCQIFSRTPPIAVGNTSHFYSRIWDRQPRGAVIASNMALDILIYFGNSFYFCVIGATLFTWKMWIWTEARVY